MTRSVVTFTPVAAADAEGARWLRWMDAEVFPADVPFVFQMANWSIGWEGEKGAAYCGWKPVMFGSRMVGFHYRAGVLPKYRGRRLQARMLNLREREMRRQGIVEAVSYTDSDNAPSMRSLIAAGYRPYRPTETTQLAGLGRTGFVHWRKEL